MRIAIVLVTRWWRASIDLDGCAHALQRLGHEPIMVCLGNDAGEATFPVIETTAEQQNDPDFWRGLNLDAAIVFSWLRKPALLKALTSAGVFTVSRADSDGQCSVRVFPRPSFRNTVTASDALGKLKQTRHFFSRYRSASKTEDAEILEAAQIVDAITIETGAARDCLGEFFKYYGQEELLAKVSVIPHTVDDLFLSAPVVTQRPRRIFCGGRWADSQKDAPLLRQTMERVLKNDPQVEFVIAGAGADDQFGELAARTQQVKVIGMVPKAELPAVLGECRFILSTSRWETQPIGTLEALCCGCTAVAPPMPGFNDIIGADRFGTLANAPTAAALEKAVAVELEAWETGRRDAAKISQHWKSQVSNDAVAKLFLAQIQGGGN